jgi:hypothetical protein
VLWAYRSMDAPEAETCSNVRPGALSGKTRWPLGK